MLKECFLVKFTLLFYFIFYFKGLRTKHPDRNAGDAVGSFRNRACLHLRHKKTSTHDYFRERKALIQTCLNSPDPPVSQIPNPDQRMSATGYEETDLTYTVNENDAEKMQVRFIV